MRRIRWRRAGKWTAAGFAGLFVAAWLIGGWWVLRVAWGTAAETTWISVTSGTVEVGHINHPTLPPLFSRFEFTRRSALRRPLRAWQWWFYRPQWTNGMGIVGTSQHIPLWVPCLGATALAAVLWRLDRRGGPGQCPECGYDLTGNTTGVCPECGLAAGAA